MPLHDCPFTFEQLALDVLPDLFRQLSASSAEGVPMKQALAQPTSVPANPGCYVVMFDGRPQYVGIAKNLRSRVRQHLTAGPSGANLAVRIAAKSLNLTITRVKSHPDFPESFVKAQSKLHDALTAWVQIDNPLVMYLFEPYAAMQFDTGEFNRFDTLQILSPKRSIQQNTSTVDTL